ncbi:TonB-dependent receptor [Pseudomonadales bacterium]|nr:TonB-dependent receptor [Pseudomonadales bacterium]
MLKRTALFSSILIASTAQAQIQEVIVTATKQEASTQDIPVAVSALGQEALEQLGITDFTDYLIQMPGVTAGGSGPGQNTIYIRGVASTTPNLTTSGVAGLAPNVALYLDEQPLSQPGRNLDVYAADMNRVEVLKGPQGTLFGASSQAGTVRLITNKPDPSGVSGKVKFGAAFTEGGEPSNNVEAVINVPVSDSITVRGVVYVDNQGGYIDNVAGSVSTAQSARFQAGGFQPGVDLSGVDFVSADNGAKVEDDINEVTYAGSRLSGLWQINDDWSLLVGVAQQTMDAEGVFFQDPELDDLEIQRYEDNTLEDEFVNTSWTLEGRLGALDVIYAGAFTDRESNQRVDYTDYLFAGQYIPYYICTSEVTYTNFDSTGAQLNDKDNGDATYVGAGVETLDVENNGDVIGAAPTGSCAAPNMFVKSSVKTKVQTHELRFSTDQSESVRATFGGFYSDLEIRELNDFTYPGSELIGADSFGPNFSAQGASISDAGVWPEGVIFRNDVLRTDEQYGIFGELNIDLSEQVTATFGARWYDIEADLKGSAAGSFSNKGAATDGNAGNNLDQIFSGSNDTSASEGFIGKVSLSWTPSEDQLYYVTWSEGFRSGFLNRPGGKGNDDYTVPFSYDTDDVTNYEFGWKLDLLDGNLRLNGDIFFVQVESLQVGIFDAGITNLFFADNAADAEIKGVEGEFIWLPGAAEGLTVSGGFSVLDTEITESFITTFVQEGDELAFAPELQLNLQARYEWELSSGQTAHVMPHISYSDEAATDIVVPNRTMLDSWTLVGVTAGVTNDQWSAELYIDNLTDERAEISGNATYNRDRINVTRPRTLGFRVSYDM